MNAKLHSLLRNRKIHYLLASVTLLVALFHTVGHNGISIDYVRETEVDQSYMSTMETVLSNRVVTDVQIRRCLRGFNCAGPNEEQPAFWTKIPTRLNLFPMQLRLFNYFMYVQRATGNDAERYVTNLVFTVTDKVPDSPVKNSKWIRRRVAPNSFLWINYLDTIDFDVPVVRDVNVLFGKQDMRDSRRYWKFEPASIPLPGRHSIQAKVSMLRIAVTEEINIIQKEQEFNSVMKKNGILLTDDSRFKIIQMSDLHIGQDTGVCYDKCKFDVNTLRFMREAIKQEDKVGLIVITGDMIDYRRAVHFESVVLKALSPILETDIPFVFTFGDSDFDPRSYAQKISVLNFIASLPNCYNNRFVDLDHRLHGLSNGNLKIYRSPPLKEGEEFDVNKLLLEEPSGMVTYLDSENQRVKDSQVNYIYRINHGFSTSLQQKLLFFHYPLPNFRPQGKIKLIGSYNEKHPLPSKTDLKFLQDMKATGYKAVAVGHEHENDACIWDENEGGKAILCYSGVTGESANTRIDQDYKRRLRVFQFDFQSNRILSWKRDLEKSIDPQEIWSAETSG